LGVTLALLSLRGRRFRLAGVIHGLAGAAGLGLLMAALQGPRHGDAMGMGSFGAAAAVLFGFALALGLTLPWLFGRAPRASGLAVATHATFAITAFVLFLAWTSAG
jgi:hypothetical protein